MLAHLHIQHYALISDLDIDLADGFSVITGETGAGKSIILGALSLAMGARADTKAITDGEDKCIIEATFRTKEQEWIIRRELYASGKSRSFVNDSVVTLAELKALSQQLLDIHSQHENLLLENDDFQLSIVDAIAQNQTVRDDYAHAYTHYRDVEQQLHDLEILAARTRKDEDYIRFQFKQLDEAHLDDPDELDSLNEEQYTLSHAEQIRQDLEQALQALDSDEGAVSMVRLAQASADAAQDASLSERLSSIAVDLRDITRDLRHKADRVEMDPQRLAYTEERITTLETLLRKHNVSSLGELISLRDEYAKQLEHIACFDDDIQALRTRLDEAYKQMQEAGVRLTRSREAVREPISEQLTHDLSLLGIQHAHMDIAIQPLTEYTERGHDDVQFLFAANLNQQLRRVSEVASGGEISRIMLCIKSLIASTHALPTILFDEIDTGVSGEIATQMGKIMHVMAQSRQIIAITHLPQIAAQGKTQYCVYKQDTDLRTETHIRRLTPEERVQEIASMLAGHTITDAVLATAQQLLNQ